MLSQFLRSKKQNKTWLTELFDFEQSSVALTTDVLFDKAAHFYTSIQNEQFMTKAEWFPMFGMHILGYSLNTLCLPKLSKQVRQFQL